MLYATVSKILSSERKSRIIFTSSRTSFKLERMGNTHTETARLFLLGVGAPPLKYDFGTNFTYYME